MNKPDANVITCQPTFTVYDLLVKALGGTMHPVYAREDLSIDADAIIAIVERPIPTTTLSKAM